MKCIIFDFDGPILEGRKAAEAALAATCAHFSAQFGLSALSSKRLPLLSPRQTLSAILAECNPAQQDFEIILSFYEGQIASIEQEMELAPVTAATIRDPSSTPRFE